MKDYLVEWHAHVEAANAGEAAKKALSRLRLFEHERVFKVTDASGNMSVIEVNDE